MFLAKLLFDFHLSNYAIFFCVFWQTIEMHFKLHLIVLEIVWRCCLACGNGVIEISFLLNANCVGRVKENLMLFVFVRKFELWEYVMEDLDMSSENINQKQWTSLYSLFWSLLNLVFDSISGALWRCLDQIKDLGSKCLWCIFQCQIPNS